MYSNFVTSKIYYYDVLHDLKRVDIIADELIDECPIHYDLSIQLKNVLSRQETIFELIVSKVYLPDSIYYALPNIVQYYVYKFHDIRSRLLLRLNSNGKIINIENVQEIKDKWLNFRKQLVSENSNDLRNMINEGDSLYTDYFLLQEEVDNNLFYKILFPQVYNQNLNRITEVGVETNYSAYDKNVKLPIEVSINVVDSEENDLYVDHYFIYEKENEILPFLQFYNNQQIYDYYYKNSTSYSFDKYGRIARGMTISQETIESQVDYLEYLSVRLAES